MTPVYRAGRQLTKVYCVVALVIAVGAFGIWASWVIATTWGLRPADGGVLKPLVSRLLLGGSLALASGAVIAGIVIYAQGCYVQRIDRLEDGRFRFTLAGVLFAPWLDVDVADIYRARYRRGHLRSGGLTVNAPWLSLRVARRGLPLIVDAQGEVTDEDAFAQITGKRAADALPRRV